MAETHNAGMMCLSDLGMAIDHYGIDKPLYVLSYNCQRVKHGDLQLTLVCMQATRNGDDPVTFTARPRLQDMCRLLDNVTANVRPYVKSLCYEPTEVIHIPSGQPMNSHDFCKITALLGEYAVPDTEDEPDDGKQPPKVD